MAELKSLKRNSEKNSESSFYSINLMPEIGADVKQK